MEREIHKFSRAFARGGPEIKPSKPAPLPPEPPHYRSCSTLSVNSSTASSVQAADPGPTSAPAVGRRQRQRRPDATPRWRRCCCPGRCRCRCRCCRRRRRRCCCCCCGCCCCWWWWWWWFRVAWEDSRSPGWTANGSAAASSQERVSHLVLLQLAADSQGQGRRASSSDPLAMTEKACLPRLLQVQQILREALLACLERGESGESGE